MEGPNRTNPTAQTQLQQEPNRNRSKTRPRNRNEPKRTVALIRPNRVLNLRGYLLGGYYCNPLQCQRVRVLGSKVFGFSTAKGLRVAFGSSLGFTWTPQGTHKSSPKGYYCTYFWGSGRVLGRLAA